jgi:hypothetical protein
LIILEIKQIAESFKKIKAKRPAQLNRANLPSFFLKKRFKSAELSKKNRGFDYLIEFDPSLKL